MHAPDTHRILYERQTALYGALWPPDALLASGVSFALTYGDLPTSADWVAEWHMPSRPRLEQVFGSHRAYRAALLTPSQ